MFWKWLYMKLYKISECDTSFAYNSVPKGDLGKKGKGLVDYCLLKKSFINYQSKVKNNFFSFNGY